MDMSTFLAGYAFYNLISVIILVDFIFRFCGINFFRGEPSKHMVYLYCFEGYIYLLKTNENRFRDNTVLASCLTISACIAVPLVFKAYVIRVTDLLYEMYNKIRSYGKLRSTIYVASLVLAAAVLSYLVVGGVTFLSTTFKERMMWRLESNVIEVEEDRTMFEDILIHPATKGEKYPLHLSKLYRYPMEDVQMTCTFTKAWLSNAHPTEYQVVWRKNGVPITVTDRHRHQLSFKEFITGDTIFDAILKEGGASNYKINATLTIYLLRESDFGSYTCHCAEHMNISFNDFKVNSAKLSDANRKLRGKNQKTEKQEPTATDGQREGAVEHKRLFQDVFLHMGEFSLIKMARRQEIIRAPASAILRFTTSYWHLSRPDDIEPDYSVNAKSFHDLCHDSYFHGCSKVLLLYWMFWHGEGEAFGLPPLQLFTTWKLPNYPAERYILIHCLCEKAYGYHNMRYVRRYYNTTKKQFELVEILHPHVLVVIPREQNMLNLFTNRSQCSPVIERPVCEKQPSVCKSSWDFQTITDFAEVVVTYFNHVEIAVFCAACLAVLYSVRKSALFLKIVGWHIRRLSLDGSTGYLATVEKLESSSQSQNNTEGIAGKVNNEEKRFDVFLSHSDAPEDLQSIEVILTVLEKCGVRVCLRDRDLPPNKTELQAISEAVEKSEKFLIFFSAAYSEDHFRKDFEAPMIIEALSDCSHGVNSVLLVKLDQCEIPPWWKHLNLHDWTTANLTPNDHHLRLLKWLEPPECRQTLRSKLDVFMTLLPLLIVGLLIFVSGCL